MSDKSVRPTLLFNLYELTRSRFSHRRRPLPSSPSIKNRNLVHTRHCAMRRARLLGQIFAPDVLDGVFLQWNRGIATLLRAVVHQPILANIEIACSRPAAPLVRTPKSNVVLKRIDSREAAFLERLHLVIHASLFIAEG